jgi:maleylacetoacetate isomerase
MPKLELYTYWRSSCSYRVRIALGYKGLSWTPIHVNLLDGENKKSDYVKTSPTGYVPCLLVDGRPFVESVAICELLEEIAPSPPLLPKSPEDRARVRALVEVVNAGTQPLQNLSVLDQVGADKERRVAWMRHFIGRGLAAFEALAARHEEESGARGPFAFGEAFTLADAVLVPQVYAARRFDVDLAAMPRVVRAESAALALPFVAAARPEAQPDAIG